MAITTQVWLSYFYYLFIPCGHSECNPTNKIRLPALIIQGRRMFDKEKSIQIMGRVFRKRTALFETPGQVLLREWCTCRVNCLSIAFSMKPRYPYAFCKTLPKVSLGCCSAINDCADHCQNWELRSTLFHSHGTG